MWGEQQLANSFVKQAGGQKTLGAHCGFFSDRIKTPTRRNFLIDVLIRRTGFLGENLMSLYIYVEGVPVEQ